MTHTPDENNFLNEPIRDDELGPLLLQLGEAEFGGSESRIQDIVELTGHLPREIAERLAQLRQSKVAEVQQNRLAELEARNRMLAADVRRISQLLESDQARPPKDEHLSHAEKMFYQLQIDAHTDRKNDQSRLFMLVFGFIAIFGILLYATWALKWW